MKTTIEIPDQLFNRSGWRRVFGLADAKTVERIDTLLKAELERVDSSEWQ